MRRLTWFVLCFQFLVAASWLVAADSDYLFVDLGSDQDNSSEANAISDGGVAVGMAEVYVLAAGEYRSRAFFYSNGVRGIDISSGDSAFMQSTARAVNTTGCAVGWTQNHSAGSIYLFLWQAASTCPFSDTLFMYDLGESYSDGYGINANNLITGISRTAADDPHAFSLQYGTRVTMTDLGVLPGGTSSGAMAVNADGVIVGYSSTAENIETATRWDDGSPTDLGAFPGAPANTHSYALAVNDIESPQIVGWSFGSAAGGQQHGFIWQDGVMVDLGVLAGGDTSEAWGVNDSGETVGWARTADYHVHAVFWDADGTITDLNTVNGIPPGWVLAEARDVNNHGEIVGRGVYGGTDRAFLLRPVHVFGGGFEDGTFDEWSAVVQ